MLDKKARDVMLLDLSELTAVCDYFVLGTADSEPQVKAMVEAVEKGLKDLGQTPWSVEGVENRSWVVLDYVDFVVHIFTQESRDTYVLEKLWGDAPQEVLEGGE
ncbi:MAG: ribosome silencing factor [Candidatus Eisenbacteria bacterium]|uniref:Ribosomal silencing factor RsfS n=1 Tax=Eiseniibacteriota bacterium TaxID=2212470 RepID=A0A7Y2H0Z7_UNCEI|nr:ribosome silencing factor [Candidatus Eisenbacteria bacterium]